MTMVQTKHTAQQNKYFHEFFPEKNENEGLIIITSKSVLINASQQLLSPTIFRNAVDKKSPISEASIFDHPVGEMPP